MKRPNGAGCVITLGGKRRKKYAARITIGKKVSRNGNVVPDYKYLGTYATTKEAHVALTRYNGADDKIEKVKVITEFSMKSEPTFKVVYDELIAYLESRPKSLSASSRRSLQASFNNLSELHKMKFKSIDYDFKEQDEEIHIIFTKDEIQAIYNDAQSDERDMLLILLYTGIRI